MIFDKEFMGHDVQHTIPFHNYTDDDVYDQKIGYSGSFVLFTVCVLSIFTVHCGFRIYHACSTRLNHQTFSENTNGIHSRIIDIVEAYGEDLNQDCPICLSNFTGSPNNPEDIESSAKIVIKLRCNHCFHKECLREWLEKNQTCPLCRTPA